VERQVKTMETQNIVNEAARDAAAKRAIELGSELDHLKEQWRYAFETHQSRRHQTVLDLDERIQPLIAACEAAEQEAGF